ncbi:MAG: TldD/PmbA family protein [Acholeplasmatales bacterium]|jgi:TldD protein|nr:TldD/PmbA family protein [Acholeplasmatales bacterium]
MIEKSKIQELLDLGLSSGATFCEIFFEDKLARTTQSLNGLIMGASTANTYGAGVRILQNTDEVYGYTNDISYESLKKIVYDLATSFKGEARKSAPLGEALKYKVKARIYGDKVAAAPKARRLALLSSIIKNYDPRIVQGGANLGEDVQKVLIVNSNGLYQDDLRIRTRIALLAVAADEKGMQDAYDAPGKGLGLEFLDTLDLEARARDVAARSIAALSAEEMVSQTLPVVLHNGFGGVIFHEACGHPLEATAVAKGLSPFVGKVGAPIGSPVVTAYDDATLEGEWGYVRFDDEGNKGENKLLIKDGILQDYMVDYRNGITMEHRPNGASRRQNYKFSPTSRMSSTFIAPGTSTFDEIIASTKYGLFAKNLGGGSVDPASGQFNFSVSEGYMIEDGKLTHQVRGATLVGNGADVLFKIDMVGNNLTLGQGVCGSISGSVPTDVGQPTLRVSSMTVGGRK